VSALTRLLDKTPSSLARLFGSDRLPSRISRPLLNRLVPSRLTSVVVRSGEAKGLTLLIDPKNEKYYWSGVREEAVQAALVELLPDGACFWDVGAHIGFFSLIAARRVGPSGVVYAFEPSRENRARLASVLEANAANNVEVLPVAVSAEDGAAVIHRHPSSTMWSLEPSDDREPAYEVECRSLDSLWREGLRAPDVVKVDVEGTEVDVLRGATGLIAEHHPVMIVEFSNDELLAEARELFRGSTWRQLDASRWVIA